MDVRLDEPVPIADADRHHGVDGDTVGGQVTAEQRGRNGHINCNNTNLNASPGKRLRQSRWRKSGISLTLYLSGYFLAL